MKGPKNILFLKETGSTQDTLRDWIRKYSLFPVIVSSEQTNGRGQRGSVWQSNKGGLWFSLSLGETLNFKESLLPLICSYSVLKVLEKMGSDPLIKWPNDIILMGKKVSGILVEKFSFKGSFYYICGFGINVNNEINVENIRYPAINLKSVFNDHIGINELLMDILDVFENIIDNFSLSFFDMILKDINKKLYLKNEFVQLEKNSETISNVILDSIGSQGELVYILNGEYCSMYSGRIIF
ncbi:biotin--[acetyl-CoA-carboxylase] ligase [Thermodesulfobium sp. 4217-1]|uniref:biotin--[acetyl-CoA-carboxylase] ligase n=1 Tax=Thermodesulfobium sp. 4217-1 TaxID=3120013 RepID=UPI003221C2F8